MPTEELGRQGAVEGFANEHIAAGILMKRYQNVSLVDLPLSHYDIIIARKREDGTEDIIRAQVKTARKSISFIGGVRGGADRIYKSDVKKYRQNTATSDVVIGVHETPEGKFVLYFVPTCLIEEIDQNSIALNRIPMLRENYEVLERCKDREFVLQVCREVVERSKKHRPRQV
ncbi:MAG: hypothetical protein N2045_01385 [Fimbriimonadales bacterium]|jgi:hypothetical protein|nr:hypothetical protein [Fimbriimonadales bacterium]GBC91340.1 hypothetical protein HRbin14_02108 [bacterium HR14]GIV12605.1 MAG: hypothetical protein KatS3mg021_0887 [Fimbriimonadales bacterium]